jgi:anthranilate phosphoribosyltransferase
MPTKYGIPLIEIWQGLGVDFSSVSLTQMEQLFKTTGLGFIYLPQHFPEAQALVPLPRPNWQTPTLRDNGTHLVAL